MSQFNLRKQFEEYLEVSLGVSKNTIKFYKSDLSHFSNWLFLRLGASGVFTDSLDEALPYINNSQALAYKAEMEASTNPVKSINRRLSTLRHFARFLVEIGLTSYNFMDEVANSGNSSQTKRTETDIPKKFALYLTTRKVSQNTIKNYLSDIKHLTGWTEKRGFINLENITPDLIQNYLADLARGGSTATLKRRLSSFKKFFDWAESEEIIKNSPFAKKPSDIIQSGIKQSYHLLSISKYLLLALAPILSFTLVLILFG